MFLQMQVIGNLGKDAWITEYNGKSVINFSVAHSEKYKDGQGVTHERTTWVECAMWGSENVAPYLKKGTQVMALGQPLVNPYQNNQGQPAASLKLNVISLKLLSSKKEGGENNASATTQKEQSAGSVVKDELADIIPTDDALF